MEKSKLKTGEISEPAHLAGTVRPKMPAAQRAKQFAPFSALRGLEKALRIKEKEIEESSR